MQTTVAVSNTAAHYAIGAHPNTARSLHAPLEGPPRPKGTDGEGCRVVDRATGWGPGREGRVGPSDVWTLGRAGVPRVF